MSFVDEHLVDHSLLTLTLFNKIYGDEYAKLVVARIGARLRLDLESEAVCLAFRLACSLHDIGKALKIYQKQFKGQIPPERFSFKYHEIPSAFVFQRISRELEDLYEINLKVLECFTLAVLSHHQAMRDLNVYLEQEQEIFKYFSLEGLGLTGEEAEDLKELAQGLKRHGVNLDAEQLTRYLSEIRPNDLCEFLKIMRNEFSSGEIERLTPLIPLFVAPIQLCDNLAASLLRRSGAPLTHRIAQETLRLLSSKSQLILRLRKSTTKVKH